MKKIILEKGEKGDRHLLPFFSQFHLLNNRVIGVCPLFLCILMLFNSSFIFAQDISVEAFVNKREVNLGSNIQLTIKVKGTQKVSPVSLPQIDGVESSYLGPSTRIQIINGETSKEISFMYALLPMQTGSFQIPSFEVMVNGQKFTTDPITINVIDGGVSNASASSSGSSSINLKDKMSVVLKLPKEEFYVNEKIPVKVLFFVSGLEIEGIQPPNITGEGFLMNSFAARQGQQVIGGMVYDIVEYSTFAYPTKSGDFIFGPANLGFNLVTESDRENFDDFFFGRVFSRRQAQPMSLNSDTINVKVLDLPTEGKPNNFSGAVGSNLNFDVSVGPKEVKVGDPITIKMSLSGDALMETVTMPQFSDNDQFKFYEPNVKVENGVKILEQVAIPRIDAITEFPAIEFSYFDTESHQYKTISKGPFPLKVIPAQKEEVQGVISSQPMVTKRTNQPETLGEDIVFIKETSKNWRTVGKCLYQSPLFLIGLLILVFLWTTGFVFYKITHRLATDQVLARRLLAPKEAKKGLLKARKLMQANQSKEFFDVILETLRQYLSHKCSIPIGAALDLETIKNHSSFQNKNASIVEAIQATVSDCEMIRYASITANDQIMQINFQRVEKIIDFCERNLR